MKGKLFYLVTILCLLANPAFSQSPASDNIIVAMMKSPRVFSEYTLGGKFVKDHPIENIKYPPSTDSRYIWNNSICGSEHSVGTLDTTFLNTMGISRGKTLGSSFLTLNSRPAWSHVASTAEFQRVITYPPMTPVPYVVPDTPHTLSCFRNKAYHLKNTSQEVYEFDYITKTFKKLFLTGISSSITVEVGLNGNIFVLSQKYEGPTINPTSYIITEHSRTGTLLDTVKIPFSILPDSKLIGTTSAKYLAVSRDGYYIGYGVPDSTNTTSTKVKSYIVKISPLEQVAKVLPIVNQVLGDVQIRDDGKIVFSASNSTAFSIGVTDSNLTSPSIFQLAKREFTYYLPRVDFVNPWFKPVIQDPGYSESF